MATGDPLYCFEHKTSMWLCWNEKHYYEKEEEYLARIRQPQDPHCVTCTCDLQVNPYPPNWRM